MLFRVFLQLQKIDDFNSLFFIPNVIPIRSREIFPVKMGIHTEGA